MILSPRREIWHDLGMTMRILPSLTLLATLAAPAWAQDRMSAAEFDAYSRGQTFYYGSGGRAYGVEEYLRNRRVRWSFLDGECKDGSWYEDNGNICFVYDDMGDPQCWSFFMGEEGMIARFENQGSTTELYEVEKSSEPMHCPGPEVGV